MPYNDNGLSIYIYGQADSPVGAGKGEQLYPTITAAARKSGKKFEDPHFPADLTTLDVPDTKNVEWHRPAEIAKALFPDAPTPKFRGPYDEFAVNQGQVGDCWFLAVLADVATKPDLIKTVVPADNDYGFAAGAFHFRFWSRGKWVDITVDDRLPCTVFNGKIYEVFSAKATKDGGFWAPLLEKAYAKMYGSYSRITAGFGVDAMMDFTGGFIAPYHYSDNPDYAHIIKEAHDQNALISMGTKDPQEISPDLLKAHDPNNPGHEDQTDVGLVLAHEYSLLDIRDVEDKDDSSVKYTLLKLRNPWGNSTEYTGDFSDSDPNNKWATVTEDLRRPDASKRNDGEFWIQLESLLPYLGEVDVCRWSATYRGYVNKDESINGWSIKSTQGKFTTDNSGPVPNAGPLRGKPCFYAHLKPVNPNVKGEVKDGKNYNCGVSITLEYLNYTKSGNDYSIPKNGFYLNWASGYVKPDDDYLDHAEPQGPLFDNSDTRRTTFQKNMPEGTLQIVPWIKDAPASDDIPYLLRIAVEGQIFTWNGQA